MKCSDSTALPLPLPVATSRLQAATATDRSRQSLLFALFVMGFGTFVNVYATQPLLPQFRQLFHASEFLVSLTVSAPIFAVALTAPLIGSMADAIGRKRVIVTAMAGLSLPTALAATATTLPQLIFWRFLQGFFVPGIIAVAMAYISEESPRHLVGSTMATYVSGTVLGGFCGRFVSGLVASHAGWRAAFVTLGVLTLAGAFITLWLLPRSTQFVRTHSLATLGTMRAHLRNRQLLATYAVGFNVLFALVGAFTYVNFYLADKPFHLGTTALASIFGVYLVGSAVTPYSGRMLDQIGYRRGVIWASIAAASGMLLTLVLWLPAVILGLALSACGAFACQAAASSHVGKTAGKARSAAAGLYVAFYYFGGSVGSSLPGLVWPHMGWTGCVAVIIGMQVITATIAHQLWRD